MNEDFTDLENELKQLRPRALPAPLMGRIATDLEEPVRRRGLLASWRTWILPAAAAAALAVVVTSIPFLARGHRPEVTPQTPAITDSTPIAAAQPKFLPVHATNVLYDAVNEGIVYLDDNTPARRMRLSYLDTITWEKPDGGSTVKWTVPREEIYYVPVSPN